MKAVLDAGIFVAHFVEADTAHAECERAVTACKAELIHVIAPLVLPPEVAGAIARRTGDESRALLALTHLRNYPWLHVRLADTRFVEQTARLAARHALRGADAFYIAVAIENRCPLITLDEEMLTRAPSTIRAIRPSEWLATLGR